MSHGSTPPATLAHLVVRQRVLHSVRSATLALAKLTLPRSPVLMVYGPLPSLFAQLFAWLSEYLAGRTLHIVQVRTESPTSSPEAAADQRGHASRATTQPLASLSRADPSCTSPRRAVCSAR